MADAERAGAVADAPAPLPDLEMAEGSPFVAPSLPSAALKGLCPRCGCPSLFARGIKFADRCTQCGLDFTRFNVGDGPAAFLTLILGTIVVALAIWLQLTLAPPLWVHMLIWIPVTALGVVGSLRLAKGALMAAEYRNAAREGQIEKPPA